ncbi:DNA glycosylase [Wolfiporia cocos MD-104 SS10]|uniref:DNA glycosylase n=1 Tax=Wolfiporia cocos (strain MD-104) TaxID=742152 RepID=A0A2H3JMQ1_WOLCO|nr:DNA glycosylase [Wolfiporia cocos MD-104 SS10]
MPPVTRSASRAASTNAAVSAPAPAAEAKEPVPAKTAFGRKRKASNENETASTTPRKKVKVKSGTAPADAPAAESGASTASNSRAQQDALADAESAPVLVPAVLSFSFDDAKAHLVRADARFAELFARMPCRPFEHLARVDPFQTLANSILGQQISWLAARAIAHRFIRLFDPSLPERPPEHSSSITFFPTARQVAQTDVTTLRGAGLSGRKAEYVLDLAARFADGRLSTEKLLRADDDALYEMLTAVRGIGRWTVDMFALFSLRRPDILPVGDLGVQRGVLRWHLALHSPTAHPLSISPAKLPRAPTEEPEGGAEASTSRLEEARGVTPDASSVPPAPATPARGKGKGRSRGTSGGGGVLPAPLTPSTAQTLSMHASGDPPPPLPAGLTAAGLAGRLDGKKKIKGALLTPGEMEALTDAWRPYRSLGVYYMWALAGPPK